MKRYCVTFEREVTDLIRGSIEVKARNAVAARLIATRKLDTVEWRFHQQLNTESPHIVEVTGASDAP